MSTQLPFPSYLFQRPTYPLCNTSSEPITFHLLEHLIIPELSFLLEVPRQPCFHALQSFRVSPFPPPFHCPFFLPWNWFFKISPFFLLSFLRRPWRKIQFFLFFPVTPSPLDSFCVQNSIARCSRWAVPSSQAVSPPWKFPQVASFSLSLAFLGKDWFRLRDFYVD